MSSAKRTGEILFRHNKLSFALALLGVAFKSLSLLCTARLTQMVLDYLAAPAGRAVRPLICYALICLMSLILSAWLEWTYWTRFRTTALRQYRERMYSGILRKHSDSFRQEQAAVYVSALSHDLGQIKDGGLESIPYLLELSLNFVGSAILMLLYNAKLALIAFVLSLLPIAASYFRMKEVETQELGLSKANARFVGLFSEVLQGFKTIKGLKAEARIRARLGAENARLSAVFAKRERVEIAVAYSASIAGLAVQLGLFGVGLLLASHDAAITVGVVAVMVQLLRNIIQVAISVPELLAGIKASRRLMSEHARLLELNQSPGTVCSLSCCEELALRDVTAYTEDGQAIVEHLTLNLPAHASYALIGESGSGKTTVLNLLAGFHKNYSGSILYDGQAIRDVAEESLFDLLSLIHQDVFIFQGSILDNICLFGTYPEEELRFAIEQAGLADLVAQKGLDYACGEQGSRLSGGEKQRIAIARNLLCGTHVLLFDEATSALDVESTYRTIESILRMQGSTRIVVTHDIYPDLMERFDRIVLLKEGRVAGEGSYRDLLRQGLLPHA